MRQILSFVLVLALLPAAADAHDATYGISGKKLVIRTDRAPRKHNFAFRTSADPSITMAHDPAAEGASLWIGGEGPNAGHTGLITLDPSLWKTLDRSGSLRGYRYRDRQGTQGGIKQVTLRPGKLHIKGGGENWAWSLDGPQSLVRVHLRLDDEWYCAEFGGEIKKNAVGNFRAKQALRPVDCPAQACGNGIVEAGETCDDGNLVEDDGCDRHCGIAVCTGETFATTFDAIQSVIFDSAVYGCSSGICHGSTQQGDLDLREGNSYDSLVGVASPTYGVDRVFPGEELLSFLHDKVSAGVNGTTPQFGGTSMPVSGTPLTPEHLEAVRLWILGGAPRDRVVEGTSTLLASCLPPPDPLIIPVPDPPPAGEGFQVQSTPWPLPAEFEDEICFATHYDLTQTDLVPAEAIVPCPPEWQFLKACSEDLDTACQDDTDCAGATNTCVPIQSAVNPGNQCVRVQQLSLSQDPQSHHTIVRLYRGGSSWDHPKFAPYTYKFQDPDNPLNGEPCDPTDVDPATGINPGCSGKVVSSVACLGFGPPDFTNLDFSSASNLFSGGLSPQIITTTEPFFERPFPTGVFDYMPMVGQIAWNSHAFNRTLGDSTMSMYLNIDFADSDHEDFPLQQIFDTDSIFAQDVPPYETREYCRTYTIPQDAEMFELFSHMHERGVRFRIWSPPNARCQPPCPEGAFFCSEEPGVPYCGPPPNDPCLVGNGPGDCIYESFDYQDPVKLTFDPPVSHPSPVVEDRSYLYCAVYDNGSGIGSPSVKQQSTSNVPPPIFGLTLPVGGPCPDAGIPTDPMRGVKCLGGPFQGLDCFGDDALCDSAPGAGDGICDACPVRGGVTTTDEMLVLFGAYYIP